MTLLTTPQYVKERQDEELNFFLLDGPTAGLCLGLDAASPAAAN